MIAIHQHAHTLLRARRCVNSVDKVSDSYEWQAEAMRIIACSVGGETVAYLANRLNVKPWRVSGWLRDQKRQGVLISEREGMHVYWTRA